MTTLNFPTGMKPADATPLDLKTVTVTDDDDAVHGPFKCLHHPGEPYWMMLDPKSTSADPRIVFNVFLADVRQVEVHEAAGPAQ